MGQMKNVSYVSEWEIVYHEVLSVSNTFRELTNANLGFRETDLHRMAVKQIKNYTNVYCVLSSSFCHVETHTLISIIVSYTILVQVNVCLLIFVNGV